MTHDEFNHMRDLRVDVSVPTEGLQNLIKNPDGHQGAWGWVSPVPNTQIGKHNIWNVLSFFTYNNQACHWYSEPFKVTAGHYYVARFGAIAATANHNVRVRMEWLDANHNVMTSSIQSAAYSATFVHHWVPAVQAIPGAVFGRIRFDLYNGVSNPAAWAQYVFSGVMVAGSPTAAGFGSVRRNLFPYPTKYTSWTGVDGTLSTAVDTPSFKGTGSMQFWHAKPGPTSLTARSMTILNLTPGKYYTASFHMKGSVDGKTAVPIIAWMTASGYSLGWSWGTWTPYNSTDWTRMHVIGRAPEGAVKADIIMITSAVEYNQGHYLDGTMFEETNVLKDYFDGDTPDTAGITYTWDGVADVTTSTATYESTRFEYNPPHAWLPITGSVTNLDIDRECFNLGTMGVTLKNDALDPAGAYEPVLKPGKHIRVQARDGATWRNIYSGKINNARVDYDKPKVGAVPERVTATNLFQDPEMTSATNGWTGVAYSNGYATINGTDMRSAWAGGTDLGGQNARALVEVFNPTAADIAWTVYIYPTTSNGVIIDPSVGYKATTIPAGATVWVDWSDILPAYRYGFRLYSTNGAGLRILRAAAFVGDYTGPYFDGSVPYAVEATNVATNPSVRGLQGWLTGHSAGITEVIDPDGTHWARKQADNGSSNWIYAFVQTKVGGYYAARITVRGEPGTVFDTPSTDNVAGPAYTPKYFTIPATGEMTVEVPSYSTPVSNTGSYVGIATAAQIDVTSVAVFRVSGPDMMPPEEDFFDGSTTHSHYGYAWDGTPDNSVSYRYDKRYAFRWTGTAGASTSEMYRPGKKTPVEAVINITAVDAMADLANQGEERAVASIDHLPMLMEGKGVPWNMNGISRHIPDVQPIVIHKDASLADQIALTRDTELGHAWIDKDGVLQVHDHTTAPTPLTITDVLDEGDAYYSKIDVDWDTETVTNQVEIKHLTTNTDGNAEEVDAPTFQDAASVDLYGPKKASYTILGIDPDFQAFANGILANNATPMIRTRAVTIPVKDDKSLRFATLVDLCNHINVVFDSKVDGVYRVNTIKHTVNENGWFIDITFNTLNSNPAPQYTPPPPVVTALPPDVAVSGFLTSAQAIPHGAWTRVQNWNMQNRLGPTDAFLNLSGVFIVKEAGWYEIKFGFGFNNADRGAVRFGAIAVNGIRQVANAYTATPLHTMGGFIAWEAPLTAGQFVSFDVFQDGQTTLNLTGDSGSGDFRTWYSIRRVAK